jgi:hypothetical protein
MGLRIESHGHQQRRQRGVSGVVEIDRAQTARRVNASRSTGQVSPTRGPSRRPGRAAPKRDRSVRCPAAPWPISNHPSQSSTSSCASAERALSVVPLRFSLIGAPRKSSKLRADERRRAAWGHLNARRFRLLHDVVANRRRLERPLDSSLQFRYAEGLLNEHSFRTQRDASHRAAGDEHVRDKSP